MSETGQQAWIFEGEAGQASPRDDLRVTPMMSQFMEIKAANPASLLFYRMGDFYELFFEDAEIASRALGITLTKRGKHLGQDIAMCGVPVHAADEYLERLIRLGHRVAVCEQTEDPAEAKKRGAKSVVRREVIRLVTPGTLTEETLLDARRHNYLLCILRPKGADELALAWLDISTGDFRVASIPLSGLGTELARLDPGEIILPDTLLADAQVAGPVKLSNAPLSPLPAARFDSTTAARRLTDHFAIAAPEAYGLTSRAEIAAAGALLDYVSVTQVGRLPKLSHPRKDEQGGTVLIDAATRANLELLKTLTGERKGSLLDAIDLTVTGAGARLFANRLAGPLTDPHAIQARLDAVAFFHGERNLRKDLRRELARAPDISRALARLTLGRGGPRDLAAIGQGLSTARLIAASLVPEAFGTLPAEVVAARACLNQSDQGLSAEIAASLKDELPQLARDGGFVREGYHSDLDELRSLSENARRVIAGLQARYISDTNFKSLKIKHNNVLGYFVELAPAAGEELLKSPHAANFIHRQTMANAMRFTTTELADIESRMAVAGERATAIEMEIFAKLVARLSERADVITKVAAALAETDVAAALGELAETSNLTRPKVDASRAFAIAQGRHPVVEQALAQNHGGAFIANDCHLSAEEEGHPIWLVTGPNMAGKSTFLRQNALIAVMAQMGSFVPAKSAHIGVIDRLFSRVGAADDLARGRSTFMVEMVETAAILNQSGPRALVILDEIGRGTATFDGLSIAWACVEHLHEVNQCRALFATHFHELTRLSQKLSGLKNVSMKVREWQGEVIFLHEVGEGAADRSYGIQVARLAGLPTAVLTRAAQVMQMLEENAQKNPTSDITNALPLFDANAKPALTQHPALAKLVETSPDQLTPREALDLLYVLKQLT
jgi:DNA mismatch repair protein MutS